MSIQCSVFQSSVHCMCLIKVYYDTENTADSTTTIMINDNNTTVVADTGRKRILFHSKWANSICYNYL